jgi:hypothetical protein
MSADAGALLIRRKHVCRLCLAKIRSREIEDTWERNAHARRVVVIP